MVVDEKILAQFLLLIQKMVSYSLRHTEHIEYVDDIVNETFIKLYKSDFFSSYTLDNEECIKISTSYIKKVISTCKHDYLIKSGIFRRSNKRELERTGFKTQQITDDNLDEIQENNSYSIASTEPTSEELIIAHKAYRHIQRCFSLVIANITDVHRSDFLYQAFWEGSNIDYPITELAIKNKYTKSNPTQDFNRFVEKVSKCTEKNHIKIVKSGEQIEFLRQMISKSGDYT